MTTIGTVRLWGSAAVLALTASCYVGLDGEQGDAGGSGEDTGGALPLECEGELLSAVAPIRRMTDVQYRNTIADVFDGALAPGVSFPETLDSLSYTSYPDANIVSQLGAEEILMAAEEVAAEAVDNVAAVLPCDPTNNESGCADQFIDQFGSRAYRRPLRDEERVLLRGLYDDARAEADFADAIGRVIAAGLQMPQFLYLIEVGTIDEAIDDPNVVRLTDHEIASRLSYLLWDTMPDDELRTAADAGELHSPEAIEAQARRLLNDPRSRAVVARVNREWLSVDQLDVEIKDTDRFPAFDETLVAAMEHEFDRFVEQAYWGEGASLETLLTSSQTVVNQPLAQIYGLGDASNGPDDWQPVELDATRRAGILSLPGLISANSSAASTNPIFRGKLVRTQLLCDDMPPPPPDIVPPEFPEDASEREKTEIMMGEATCAGCHALMNPIGLAFENYDPIGVWRTEDEHGNSIDASGEIFPGPSEVAGPFHGVVELGQLLAEQDATAECVVRQWTRYTYGRRESADDDCLVLDLANRFAESGHDLGELLVALTQTDGFRYRAIGAE